MAAATDPEEPVDLDPDRRQYVADLFGRLASLTHYELLGVAPAADKKTIKRTYFELVRTMHPDRYFGKRLGDYRPKLEAIFSRMTLAYEVLADAAKRSAYDSTLAPPSSRGGPAPAIPVDPKVAEARRVAMEALKARFTANKAKAKAEVAAAERARAAGDIVSALASYRAAVALAPGDPLLEAALAEIEEDARQRLVDGHRKKAEIEERWGRWAEAARSWRLVLEARPDDDVRARLEAALVRAKGAAGR